MWMLSLKILLYNNHKWSIQSITMTVLNSYNNPNSPNCSVKASGFARLFIFIYPAWLQQMVCPATAVPHPDQALNWRSCASVSDLFLMLYTLSHWTIKNSFELIGF